MKRWTQQKHSLPKGAIRLCFLHTFHTGGYPFGIFISPQIMTNEISNFRSGILKQLTPAYKLLWLFILKEAKEYGIYSVNIPAAKDILGLMNLNVSEQMALEHFKPAIVVVDAGTWFIPGIIEERYGKLKDGHKPHIKPVTALKRDYPHAWAYCIKYKLIQAPKVKDEKTFAPPKKEDVIEYFTSNGYREDAAIKAFQFYHTAEWHDTAGRPVKNWKQKMVGVWFKDENKIPPAPKTVDGKSIWDKAYKQ